MCLRLHEDMQYSTLATCNPMMLVLPYQCHEAGTTAHKHGCEKLYDIVKNRKSSSGMPEAVGLGPPPQEPVFRWEPWRSCTDAVEESALAIAAGGGGSLGVVGMDAWGHTNYHAPSLSAQQMRVLLSILRGS